MKKNENGFGSIEIILTIVVLGLLVGLGFYVYNQNQPKDDSHKTPSSTQTNTANETGLTASSASKAVTDFYNKYVALDPPGNAETFIQQHGTDKLLAYYKANQNGVDPIVCAQTHPDSFKVTSSTISQSTATVTVEETFGTRKITVTATVIDQNGLKIDSLKCSVPLPSGENGGH